jgi:hypothetical protein
VPARDVPAGLTPEARQDWASLGRPAGSGVFERTAVRGLPEPVGRWLTHAIPEGTPLATAVQVRTHGEIRIGTWARFTAVQRIGLTGGYVWAASARVRGLPVVGFDRWTGGTGEMRWRLLGLVPVMSADGEDVARSAAGRHAGELLLLAPGAALSPELSWRGLDADRATAVVRAGGTTHEVTLTVGPDGALTELVMQRWGDAGGGAFAEQPFGALLHGEATFGGVAVPRQITAGWQYGTDHWPEGQFIRLTVDDLRPC